MFHRTSAVIGVGPFMPEEAISQPLAYQGIQCFTFWGRSCQEPLLTTGLRKGMKFVSGEIDAPHATGRVLLSMRCLLRRVIFRRVHLPPLTTFDSSDSLSSILWKNGRDLRTKGFLRCSPVRQNNDLLKCDRSCKGSVEYSFPCHL